MATSRLAVVAALALAAGTARAQSPLESLEREQQALFEQVAPAVVFISAGDRFGSGFFVNHTGLVLTNAHVVGERATVDVVLHDGRKLQGRVAERGPGDLDLALVQVQTSSPALAMEGGSELRVGSWVGSVGHGMGGIWAFTTGMVTNIYPVGSSRPVFQTQIPLNPGNSGGPVFDRKGRVVGVATAELKESNSMNLAIRTDVALQQLAGLSGLCDCVVIRAPAKVPIFLDGKMVGQGPQVVVPVSREPHEAFAVIRGQMVRRRVTFPADRQVDLGGTGATAASGHP